MALDPAKALGHLPAGLRTELITEYDKIVRNYRERRWEAAELDGGRFCEVAYTVLAGHVAGDNYPTSASKPSNFKSSCERLEQADKAVYSDSVRITIPRVLVGLYDVRNRRGVGHVGGDVDANHMDAEFVIHSAQWVMAEFVRHFHATTVSEATQVVDALVDRTLPLIWNVGVVTRLLDTNLSLGDGTLLLLYSASGPVTDKSLAESLEQNRIANYKRVLNRLHSQRHIEYQERTGLVTLSPRGVKYVEERVLPARGDL